MQIAVEIGDEAMAFPVSTLRQVGVANVTVDGVPVAVVAEPDAGGRWDAVRGLPVGDGERLDPLGALTIFPADFPVHFPGGEVWRP